MYEQLEAHGLTVVGGRVKDVGVGGLVPGGGMSHFSNYWGLMADNVNNFEVTCSQLVLPSPFNLFQIVLADFRIVQVNANSRPDLFKALKGGGPNFGKWCESTYSAS